MAIHMIPPVTAPKFLAESGWAGAQILPLAGDASFRRYFRIVDEGRTAVLMDAPPEHEDSRPFVEISEYLQSIGLSSPKIISKDYDIGLILLEDFGDDRVASLLLNQPELEIAIYERAIDVLIALHKAPVGEVAAYDEAVLLREVALLVDWYAPAFDLAVDLAAFNASWGPLFENITRESASDPVLVLRDYHADNLMWLPGRSGLEVVGLLDFQDALLGHRAYDLVSLLQDARRDVSPDLEEAMLQRYIIGAGIADPEMFRAHYEILGAQRNIKILGIFTRLWKRDGKLGYKAFQPRVWGYLEKNLQHPALQPVKQWMDLNIPENMRAKAWEAM